MKLYKYISITLLAIISILSIIRIPVASAQTVLGQVGAIDTPANNSTVSGQSLVRGWFLDKNGVSKVEVLVDGAVAGQAIYGDARPDVKKAFPAYNNGYAGFHYTLDSSKFVDGKHTVTIRETNLNGNVTTLPGRTMAIANVKGRIDSPVSGTTLTGTQNISGWILDNSGVAKIEVLVDGAVAGQATYGDARPDVKKAFPAYNDGNAGFHYTLDSSKFADGKHTITIRETNLNGNATTLPSTTITIANDKGSIDSPVPGAILSGTQNVSGWFLDKSGVSKIEVLVDGTVAGQATYGDARPDVQKAFPTYNNGNAGFHYSLNTSNYSEGKHSLTIRETGTNGQVTTMSARTITIENIIGYIDNPASGTKLTGIENVSGWFLDKSGVAKIEVLVDGTLVGQATYGDSRPDILKAFPDFNNGNAGFHYSLDTSKYGSGQHTIVIRETGDNGKVTTLPAVTFKTSYIVFLDPGHGGSDPGATAGGVDEKNLNLAVAEKVQAILLSRGYTVYMSRTTDTYVSLLDRSQMANNLHADIYVSIHTNATDTSTTTVSGFESYYYQYDPGYPSQINAGMDTNPDRIAKSKTLANIILGKLVSYTGAANRGSTGESLSVVRESAMPATLLELGFINNPSERQKLISASYQNTEATAIADGIDAYFKSN